MNLKTIRGFSEFESHELVFGVIKFTTINGRKYFVI